MTEEQYVVTENVWFRVLRLVGVPFVSVLLAMAVGSLLILFTGGDPVLAFSALLQGAFGGPVQIGETILRTTPLIFTGLAVAFGFRANLFNIGAEGQLAMGALAAAWFGLLLAGLPSVISVPALMLGGAIFGAAWAFVPAILKARVGAHEVITTMMFSWIALYLVSWMVNGPLSDKSSIPETAMLSSSTWLVTLDQIIPGLPPVRAHLGFAFAFAMAILVWWILNHTVLGYSVRAVGFNGPAAENGGISVARTTIWALCISGALAGMAGASEVLGVQHRLFDQVSASSGFGFTGIAVALLAKNNPMGVIFSALLFGALAAGSGNMQLEADISPQIITVIQGLIIFFVGAETIVTWFIKRRQRLALEAEVVPDAQ
jgi:general nucleoside transport system permease protein